MGISFLRNSIFTQNLHFEHIFSKMNKSRASTLTNYIKIGLEFLAGSIKKLKEIIGIEIKKDEVTLYSFVDHIVVHVKYPK